MEGILFAMLLHGISTTVKILGKKNNLSDCRKSIILTFAYTIVYEVCSKSNANLEFSRITYIRI